MTTTHDHEGFSLHTIEAATHFIATPFYYSIWHAAFISPHIHPVASLIISKALTSDTAITSALHLVSIPSSFLKIPLRFHAHLPSISHCNILRDRFRILISSIHSSLTTSSPRISDNNSMALNFPLLHPDDCHEPQGPFCAPVSTSRGAVQMNRKKSLSNWSNYSFYST